MSDGLTATDQMVSANRIIPWHRKGNVVDGSLTIEEAITLANLDWTVEKYPVTVAGSPVVVPGLEDMRAVIREDTGEALGIVRDSYQTIQNSEVFKFLDNLLDTGDIEIETAGSIRGGRWVWVLARIPRGVDIDGDDYATYMAAITSHDATLSLSTMPTNVRIVCQNTCNFALGSARRIFKVRHTLNADKRIAEARKVLGLTFDRLDAFSETMNRLQDVKVTDDQFEAIVDGLFPEKDDASWNTTAMMERTRVKALWHGDTVGQFTGTGYGAFQAINEWEQWLKSRLPDDDQRVFNIVQDRLTRRADKVARLTLTAGLPSNPKQVRKMIEKAVA